MTPPWQEGTNQ